jgi:hypothetical protein
MLSNCVKSSYFNVDMCPIDYSYIYIYTHTYYTNLLQMQYNTYCKYVYIISFINNNNLNMFEPGITSPWRLFQLPLLHFPAMITGTPSTTGYILLSGEFIQH